MGDTQGGDENSTPQDLFDVLNSEFDFEIDLAASELNHKLPVYYTKENSAFNYEWDKNSWCNPPYSRESKTNPGLFKWCKRAKDMVDKHHSTIVFLIPADTSTRYFRFCFHTASQIRFLPRIKFGGAKNTAKFGSMLVVFEPLWRGDLTTRQVSLSLMDYKPKKKFSLAKKSSKKALTDSVTL